MTSVFVFSSCFLLFTRFLNVSFMDVVAINVLWDVCKGSSDEIEQNFGYNDKLVLKMDE